MAEEAKQRFGEKEYDEFQFKLRRATNLDLYKRINLTARRGVNGLMIGSIAGVVGFWLLNKPVFWGAVVGGLTGGVIEVAMFSKAADNETKTV